MWFRYWGEGAQARESRPYDMWSVGITWLELIFGTPHVFGISERQRIMLNQALHLDRQPPVRCPSRAVAEEMRSAPA